MVRHVRRERAERGGAGRREDEVHPRGQTRSRRMHCAERAALGGASAASLPRRGRWPDAGCCAATCGLCGFSERPARFVRVSRALRRLGVSIEARAHSARTVETGWTCSNAARELSLTARRYPFLVGQPALSIQGREKKDRRAYTCKYACAHVFVVNSPFPPRPSCAAPPARRGCTQHSDSTSSCE